MTEAYMTAGVPFKIRCDNAHQALESMWSSLIKIANADSAFGIELRHYYVESIKGNSPNVQVFLEESFRQGEKTRSDALQKMLETFWKEIQYRLEPIWGEDAVEVAAKALSAKLKPQ